MIHSRTTTPPKNLDRAQSQIAKKKTGTKKKAARR